MTPADPPNPVEDHRFPCDQCGSDMRYLPGTGRLHCDHCGNEEEIAAVGPWGQGQIAELDFLKAADNDLPPTEVEDLRVLTCPNCGAQIEFREEEHSKDCPFCATPIVTDTGTHRIIKPKGVLPFAIDEAAARDAMRDWLGSLWFAPNGLQAYARTGRRMSGIYIPYWTFDAQTDTRYQGSRGTVYTTGSGKNRRQHVRWRAVSGRVARFFDDVLVLATDTLPRRYTDGLPPWDLPALTPYQPEYLAGFRSEAYRLPLTEAFGDARAHMDQVIARDIRFDIGGDRQRIHSADTQVSDVTFKHVLLPIWTAAYRYRGEAYRIIVNGRTGRVQGERPWSKWKIALAIIAGTILAAVLGYLYAVSEGRA